MDNDLISRADVLDLVQSYGPATYDMPYGSGDMIIRPEDVMALPAVDAVLVRHGRWKPDTAFGNDIMSGGRMVLCSRCGKGVMTGPVPYCPWCGAKMDGGKDNATN